MEQIVKLTGRIAKVFPITKGTSQRTGNAWVSQEYLFEYHSWSGATVPDRIVVRVFGEDRIKNLNLQEREENVTLTLRFQANEYGERWFNEIRVASVERATSHQPSPQEQQPTPTPAPQTDNNNQEGDEKDNDLPF